ncbi:putative ABC transporter permease [uncultured Dysosmobacter sp.]|uniref:putative ABC transporter permease n=1 Tax=uncultured Dysosmobacter sp. TaxID=2591384 RepID=UPI00261A0928|nr:hypothetical protein [uncultured Dysosmobacter sp.]
MRKQIGRAVLSVLLWTWIGTAYYFGEIVWKTFRGRPETISWTMLILAIFLAIPLERFGAELPWEMPLPAQAVICGLSITAAEFAAGCVLNLWLGLGVWDYSEIPGNLLGQVCPQFTLLWCGLSVIGIVILDFARYAVEGGERPRYRWL